MKQTKIAFLWYFLTCLFIVFVVFYVVPGFRGDVEVRSGFFLGPYFLRFYGLIVGLSILVSWIVVLKSALARGIPVKKIENILFWTVVSGFLGARLYFVVFSWDFFKNNPDSIFKIWEGGLAIFGAIICGLLATLFYAKRSGLGFLTILDLFALAVPLGQAIGRWGNFFNQEAYGLPTSLPWKMFVSPDARLSIFAEENFFHPTFLYESIWDLLVFVILIFLFKKNPRPGLLVGNYLILYSIGRFFIQPLRIDSLMWGSFRIDQLTALLFMALGILFIFYTRFYEKSFRKNF